MDKKSNHTDRNKDEEIKDDNRYFTPVPDPPESEHRSFWAIFQLRSAGYPWKKASLAALSMGVPLLIAAIVGNLSLGLLAAMGGLTAAYTNNEPYVQRALRLLLILIGLSLSMALGILSGGNLWLTTFSIAGVSTLAFFICETWRVPKPSGYLFTLACAVGTGLPIPVSAALSSSGLVALGGCWAWILAMSGFMINPRGPENTAVENAYKEVAGFLSAVGSSEVDYKERNATVALRAAQEAVQAAEIRRLPRTGKTDRLRGLTHQANTLFLAGVELSTEESGKLINELAETVCRVADAVADPKQAQSIQVPPPAKETAARNRVYRELSAAVSIAAAEKYDSKQRIRLRKQSVRETFLSAFNSDSLVLPKTLRIGISLVAATLIAGAFGVERPYWVPLTCAAVLNGTTPVTIFHRSIQRAAGTTVGIFVGASLVALQSSPFIIAFAIMALQFCIQFTIPRNYGFGVTFITPLALLMAESGRSGVTADSLIAARLLDTITGCVIGVIGGLLLWRRASSTRLPAVLGELIRNEGKALQVMFGSGESNQKQDKKQLERLRRNVETALVNVRSVYDTGTGELKQQRKVLEAYWPAVVAAQRIGYLVLAGSRHAARDTDCHLASDQLQQLESAMNEFADASKFARKPGQVELPAIHTYPSIDKELQALHEGLAAGGLAGVKLVATRKML